MKSIKLTLEDFENKLKNGSLFQFNETNGRAIRPHFLLKSDVNQLKKYGVLQEKSGKILNVVEPKYCQIVKNAACKIIFVQPVKKYIYVVTYQNKNKQREVAGVTFNTKNAANDYAKTLKNGKVTLVNSYMDYE